MKHPFHLFALATLQPFVKTTELHWIWISKDGYIGISKDDYNRNMNQFRFVRPEWMISVDQAIDHLWSSPRFQEQIQYIIYECNDIMPHLYHLEVEYDDDTHRFDIKEQQLRVIYSESIYDCLEDMDKLQTFRTYLGDYFRSKMLEFIFNDKCSMI